MLDEKFEHVRNQCGSHSITSMSIMLGLGTVPMKVRIKKEKLDFSEKAKHECPNSLLCDNCYFCNMKKENERIDDSLLFPFLNLNNETGKKEDRFECKICDQYWKSRGTLFTHIKSVHKTEIFAKDISLR